MKDEERNGIPSVETARLLLRSFTSSDLDNYTRCIFADAEVMCYLPRREASPHERAERTIGIFNDHWLQRGYGVWAIMDKIDETFIGHCGLNYLADIDEVEVLYALRHSHWSRGFATEAARASVQFGFERAQLTRLIGLAVPENIASRRVLEHLGFTFEKKAHHFGLDLACYALHHAQFHSDDSVFLVG